VVGQLFDLAGVAFLDRANRAKAIEALKPAVDTLRGGTSVVMAPEGTRSLTRRWGVQEGRLPPGSQAGVPIVPIVIRNPARSCGATRAPRGPARWSRGAPADQHRRLTAADIDDAVHSVRQLYVDTLDHWPGRPRREPNRPTRVIADTVDPGVGAGDAGRRSSAIRDGAARYWPHAGSWTAAPRVAAAADRAPSAGDTREVDQLLRSDSFRAAVAKLADGLDVTETEAMAEAAGYLREMSRGTSPG